MGGLRVNRDLHRTVAHNHPTHQGQGELAASSSAFVSASAVAPSMATNVAALFRVALVHAAARSAAIVTTAAANTTAVRWLWTSPGG